MGIQVEFNYSLALRNISEHNSGERLLEECIPANLRVGEIYEFRKRGQRLYAINQERYLIETKGAEDFTKEQAKILILELTHFLENGEVWTKGKYKVLNILTDVA